MVDLEELEDHILTLQEKVRELEKRSENGESVLSDLITLNRDFHASYDFRESLRKLKERLAGSDLQAKENPKKIVDFINIVYEQHCPFIKECNLEEPYKSQFPCICCNWEYKQCTNYEKKTIEKQETQEKWITLSQESINVLKQGGSVGGIEGLPNIILVREEKQETDLSEQKITTETFVCIKCKKEFELHYLHEGNCPECFIEKLKEELGEK